jgi:hypothetical protein
MNWHIVFLLNIGIAVLLFGAGYLLVLRLLRRRFQSLKKDLAGFSGDLLEMIELQSEVNRRISRSVNDVEEKVLNLAVPSSDETRPLERRYQVMALARKGMPSGEIAERLNMSKGEADLILRLRNYVDRNGKRSRKNNGAAKSYVPA